MSTLLSYNMDKDEVLIIIDGKGYRYKSVTAFRTDEENKYFTFTGIETVENTKCDISVYADVYELKPSISGN